jgi:ABC-type branched-subunit amino acid transport system substrate-binding protein
LFGDRWKVWMLRFAFFGIGVSAVLAVALLPCAGQASTLRSSSAQVVVHRGRPVQIAFADPLGDADYPTSFANAIRMAVHAHPRIRGFRVRVNLVRAPCGDATADVAAATTITANRQNVAVLGQMCSSAFDQALPIYQAAGIVTISGSATGDALPMYAPTVFDRTVVRDGDGLSDWYALVQTLASDLAWRRAYVAEFDSTPRPFADLYFDATRLLLARLRQVSHVVGGSLVIDRAALARAIRNTTSFPGVTCTIRLDPATGNRVNDPSAFAQC